MSKIPVVAVIPNYNMGNHLNKLLPNTLNQGYDQVFVLDDNSSDYSYEIARTYAPEVTTIKGDKNVGAGYNRNRIINHVGSVLLHFIDADVDILTENSAKIAQETYQKYPEPVGAIGGLVSRLDGSQEPYNYGPAFQAKVNLTAWVPLIIDQFRQNPKLAEKMYKSLKFIMKDWPNVLDSPKPCQTFWVHESNMIIHSDVFRKLGGYNERLRAHEAQDLALRLEKHDLKRYFDPSIEVLHHQIDVRYNQRQKEQLKAMATIIKEHGVRQWLSGKVQYEGPLPD